VTIPPRCVVLVEGPSDAVVLDVLARRLGLATPEVEVVSMGGVTNIRAYLATYDGLNVAGLCDGGEMRFFARALRRRGHEVETRDDLLALGFFVCEDDLEDELIRALGTDAVIEVVARQGELGLLHTFQQQPAQRGRSLHDQLHRFFGTKSGRKHRLAAALAAEVGLDRVPAPLLGVLTFATTAV
jgi:Overcoming lysogenization defect protein-like, TOPRIM domain